MDTQTKERVHLLVYPAKRHVCFVPEAVDVVYAVVVVDVVVGMVAASFGKTAAIGPHLPLLACPTWREIWGPSLDS